MRPCPHVSVFVWKRELFFADCLPVHTYSVTENGSFQKSFPEWKCFKTPFSYAHMDRWKRNFSRMLTSWYAWYGILREIENGRRTSHITFVSLLLGLISSLMACLEINIALPNVQADYVRRLNIIGLLSLQIWKASQKRFRRLWVRPGRTSVWWDNLAAEVGF